MTDAFPEHAGENFRVILGNSLDVMNSMDAGSVDCVITDPPYQGFGFHPAASAYWAAFLPYYEAMARVCRGKGPRLALSQPGNRRLYVASKLPEAKILRIEDAFADGRGEPAEFYLMNPLAEPAGEPEAWSAGIVPPSDHPNDRDIGKMAIVVKAMSAAGDTVLDPFCGSAAIGVACLLLGRRYIGIELIAERVSDAEARLRAVEASGR